MTFYKVRRSGGSPCWFTLESNACGMVWVNFNGGWCPKRDDDEVLAKESGYSKDEFIERHRQEVYSYLVKPNSTLGWLSPDGRFYGCDFAGHAMLAAEYFGKDDLALEEEGWIKVFRSVELRVPVYCQLRTTSAQIAWLEDKGIPFHCC